MAQPTCYSANLQGDSAWQKHPSVLRILLCSLHRCVGLASQMLLKHMVWYTEQPLSGNLNTHIPSFGQGQLCLLIGDAHVHHGSQKALVHFASGLALLRS